MKLLRWVAHDKHFKPTQVDGHFKHWSLQSITIYCHIPNKGLLNSFQKLQDKFPLEKQYYRYLQLRTHFISIIKTTEEYLNQCGNSTES